MQGLKVCLQKYNFLEKDLIDAIQADEIITRSWTVWMKYCSNESWSKVQARIGNWGILHRQYLVGQIVDIKGKKPSGWKIRNKLCHDHHQSFEQVREQAQISQGRKDLGQKTKKRLDEGS